MKRTASLRYRLLLKNYGIFLMLLFVAVIPLVPFYRSLYAKERQALLEQTLATLEKGEANLRNELSWLIAVSSAFHNDTSFKRVARTRDVLPRNEMYTLIDASQILQKISHSSELVFENYILFSENRMAFSRTQVITNAEKMYQYNLSVPGMDYDAWRSYLFSNTRSLALKPSTKVAYRPTVVADYAHKEMIHCIVSLPYDRSRQRDSVFLTLLDTQAVLDSLTTELVREEGFLYIAESNQQFIYHKNYTDAPLDVRNGISDHKDFYALTVSMPEYGLQIVAGLPADIVTAQVLQKTWLLNLSLPGLLLLGLGATYWLSRRQLRLIEEMQVLLGNHQTGPMETKLDLLAYIRMGIQRLIQESLAYQMQIEQMREQARVQLTHKLLMGRTFTVQEQMDFRRLHGIEHQHYVLVYMTIADSLLCQLPFARQEGLPALFAEEAGRVLPGRVILHSLSAGKCVAIISVEKSDEASYTEILTACQAAAKALNTRINLPVRVGLSQGGVGEESLSRCLEQAREAADYPEDSGNGDVRAYVQAQEAPLAMAFSPVDSQSLSNYIYCGENEQIYALFAVVRDKLTDCRLSGASERGEFFLSVRSALFHAAARIGVREETIAEECRFDEEKNMETLLAELEGSAIALGEMALQMRKSRNHRQKMALIDYLEQNYGDASLCASNVAEQFHFSEKYLYHIVREYTGQSFGQFLQDIRLQKAETLLRDTGLPIAQIHEKVGFTAVNTFYKAFKRRYGVSPTTWRSIVKGQEAAQEA